jgi:signal transduction histidine kinase
VENARLYKQAEEVAATAERGRLARDLHDAVSQTLFSASLIADVLPRLWERDTVQGLQRLNELRQLTRGALAEMRTLLLELRPAALEKTPLSDLLQQLSEAFSGRSRIPTSLTIEGQRPLPAEVKVTLYRITQEALNNVSKHANPQRVEVHLLLRPERAMLHITDNGRGFEHASVQGDHLGLQIMQERARGIDATFEIESRTGQGTDITVSWNDPSWGKE